MMIEQLRQSKIGILGFGQEGQAVLEYLTKHALTATVYERKTEDSWSEQQKAIISRTHAEIVTGSKYLQKALANSEVIFKSPGVLLSPQDKQQITEQQITLTSQTVWFFEHCPALIVGVTGTKGKGTTSSLITSMLNNAKHPVFLTGNIGKEPPLSFLDELTENDTVVFELSSFQLEHLNKSPHIGICLMVTSDHLDYHTDRDDYWSAKSPIAKFQTTKDTLIYNTDYDGSRNIGQLGMGKKLTISSEQNTEASAKIDTTNQTLTITVNNESEDFDVSQRQLVGDHNLENIAAAVLAAKCLQIPNTAISKTIAEFTGLPHRLQLFGQWQNIKFYDDSIATNPDTVIAAVKSFTAPVVLILGGADKQLDYSELIDYLKSVQQVKQIILVGNVGKILEKLFIEQKFSVPYSKVFKTFNDAVTAACQAASSGDVVLLSPAATSFDMFRSYSERGDQFQKLVRTHYEQN